MKTYIFVVLTLIFIVIATQPLDASTDFSRRNKARLEVQEIASIINMMKASPSSTMYYKKSIPHCETIEINDDAVRMQVDKDLSITYSIIKMDVTVSSSKITCDGMIEFTKHSGTIEVK